MKKDYKRYGKGELLELEKKLPKEDKKTLEEFLRKCSVTAGEGKLQKIKRILLQFRDITELSLNKQDKDSVISFLILLNKSDRSTWTKNEIKVYLKQFLKWKYKDLEMIENIKSSAIRINNQKINESNLITEEELEKMLRHAEGYRDKAYLLLLFYIGARPQELSLLTWKDVNFQENYADITLYSGKTRKSRTFPIVEQTKEALWDWREHFAFPDRQEKDFVFPSPRHRDKPMTSVGLNKIVKRIAKLSGIKKDVWNYLFRHSRATKLYEELPTPIVEKLLGHKNMSGIYAHISSKKAREVMLNKIYKIEQLTKAEKDEIKELRQELAHAQVYNNLFVQFFTGKLTKKQLEEHILAHQEAVKIIKKK